MNRLLVIILILFSFTSCDSKKKNEKYYQTKFCKQMKGITEYTLPDKTRVDCLTKEYSIEVDWAKKWAEGVGQSLYYSNVTNKKAGLALICSKEDKRFIKRVEEISNEFNIQLFIINKEE